MADVIRPHETVEHGGTPAGQTTPQRSPFGRSQGDDHEGNGDGGVPAAGWWMPPPPPPPPRPRRAGRAPIVALIIIVILAAAGGGIGIGYALRGSGPSKAPVAKSKASSSALAASKVDPGLVDVNTTLGYEDEAAAGTGMVLTASGTVLTNNHVIDGATTISVTDVGNHRTYSASVVGYDLSADVAVLQLHGASGLATVPLGNSAAERVGNAVTALGNAGGSGGTPSVARGKVTALNQSITAVDEGGGASEQLTGLIETNAPLQAGDSGGALVDAADRVIGMNTAASTSYLFSGGTTQGYAIPINRARTVATDITHGEASDTVHIGATAFLGILVGAFPGRGSTGAVVEGVSSGTPAQAAGLAPGDVIATVNGQSVTSPTDLTTIVQALRPGQTIQLGWQDPSGQSHTASVTLASGPPA